MNENLTRPTGSTSERPRRAPNDVDPTLREVIAHERLTRASAVATCVRLGLILGGAALASVGALVVGGPVTWMVAVAACTSALVSAPFAIHEALHGSLFNRRWLNDAVGTALGAVTFVHYAPYRTYHLEHHRRTHEQGDPEPIVVLRSRTAQVSGVVAAMPLFSLQLTWHMLRACTGRPVPWYSRTRRPGLDLAALIGGLGVLSVAVWTAASGHWGPVLGLWVLPLTLAMAIGGVFALPEHYGCSYGPASPFATSRTTYTTVPLRFLVWNGNYHTAHHLVPSVTAPHLPRLHELIRDRYEHTSPGYLAYHRSLWRELAAGSHSAPPPWAGEKQVIDLRDGTNRDDGAKQVTQDSAPVPGSARR
uniref:Fatty acid desaturase n=1 Tax=uncultured bacterium A1Q1_fos_862 TaxID=1256590 RepID=L7VTR2_9BACT|nr:fatty acid desaturase [uncultured bacterium A1Q1_fos_862]